MPDSDHRTPLIPASSASTLVGQADTQANGGSTKDTKDNKVENRDIPHTASELHAPKSVVHPWGIENSPAVQILSNAVLGMGFGLALQKGQLFEPRVIQAQFLLSDFRMIQAFLTASGTTMLLAALSNMPVCEGDESQHELLCQPISRMKTARNKNLSGKPRGLAAVAMGAGILGAGMAVAGACPGVIYPQVGSGLESAPWVLVGAVAGVLTHSVLEPVLKKTLSTWWQPSTAHLEDVLRIPYTRLAIPTSLALISAAITASFFLPSSYTPPATSPSIPGLLSALALPQWHPIVSGLLIGLLQVPSVMLLHAPLGASSAMVALVSPLAIPLRKLHLLNEDTELAKWKFPSISAAAKIVFALAAITGGYVSASVSGTVGMGTGLGGAPLVLAMGWKAQAVLGGWLLLLGARIAGGCTSGHGISGFGFLGVTSVTAVASMFAGGIAAAFAMRSVIG